MRIPNNSNDITRWWKENKCESNTITVWACNGKITLAQPEKGELICNNPNALKDGARRLHGRPVWKYLPNNRLRAIGCENRYYFTTERECWIAYSVQLEAQSRILKERQLKVTESIDTALAQIISRINSHINSDKYCPKFYLTTQFVLVISKSCNLLI